MTLPPVRAARTVRRISLAVLGVSAVLVGGGAAVRATAAAKADFALAGQPGSQSMQQGQSATYTLTVSGSNGFTGTVALTAGGLPSGVTASFEPSSVTLATATTSASATLTVTASSSAALSMATFTVTGTSGSTKRTLSLGLTVSKALSGGFSIAVDPATVSVAPGSIAVYTLTVTRTGVAGPITLTVHSGMPSGASATFSPNPVTGTSSTLQVATGASTADGTYPLDLAGSVNGSYQHALVQLVVDSKVSSKPFSISGAPIGPLAPGAAGRRIDLALTNPNKQALSITNLSVSITGVDKAGCTADDFAVTQYTGGYPLPVPKNASSMTLSQLGVPPSAMPQIRMLDLARDQDACKSAIVSLGYSGSGQGN